MYIIQIIYIFVLWLLLSTNVAVICISRRLNYNVSRMSLVVEKKSKFWS